MPIYEYSCKKCGNVIERIRKFSDPPLRKHPGCGGTLTKLISQSAFQLKGEGWYVTDYARKDSKEKKAENGSDGAPEAKTEGKADKKSEKGSSAEKSGSGK